MDSIMAGPDASPIFYIGQDDSHRSVPVSVELLGLAQEAGYDMMTTPITNMAYRNHVLNVVDAYHAKLLNGIALDSLPLPLVPSLTPEFTTLTPDESITALLAMTSSWIDVGSSDPVVAHVSLQVLNQEIAYAAFCGVNNVIIQGPQESCNVSQYARIIASALGIGPYLQLHILMPMDIPSERSPHKDPSTLSSRVRPIYEQKDGSNGVQRPDSLVAWDSWDLIRSFCKYSGRLSVALTIPKILPPIDIQSRWFSEPLRILRFPASSFVANAKGFPVFSKPIQGLLIRYMRLPRPPWIVLTDVGSIPETESLNSPNVKESSDLSSHSLSPSKPAPTPAEAAQASREPKKAQDSTSHLRYIRHLQQSQPARPQIDRFAAGYQDYLQSPLQPLTDNLESITYEVFEKDPIKYAWYERATALALSDLHKRLQRPIVVAVVGAGRGPLMTRALSASRSQGIPIMAYAVEKNPNAYILLQHRNATDPLWNKSVTVVKTDMRAWAGPVLPNGRLGQVDILISELLGSFADNELSPECLDGVQHVMNPEHGISIPQSYTAHLTPIATPKIYSNLVARGGEDRWELPYVVMLHQYDFLCHGGELVGGSKADVDIQQAWKFSHPVGPDVLAQSRLRKGGGLAGGGGGVMGGDGANEHNLRSTKLTFRCKNRGTCHGLSGYFETVLYRSHDQDKIVELSTNPVTMDQKSKDMISWFPIFFPLKIPLTVPDDAEMEVSLWRQTDDRKVWYEWMVEIFIQVSGRRQRCGASELHSSWKNGCLM